MRTDDEPVNWAEMVEPSPSSRKAPVTRRGGCKKALGSVCSIVGAFIGSSFVWHDGASTVRVFAFFGAVVGSLVGWTVGAVIDAAGSPQ